MVYQSLNNIVTILPKRELTLDLAEKPPGWKLLFSKSKVYPCSFIKNELQLRGFLFHWFYKIAPSKISESFIWDFFAIPLLTKLQAFSL